MSDYNNREKMAMIFCADELWKYCQSKFPQVKRIEDTDKLINLDDERAKYLVMYREIHQKSNNFQDCPITIGKLINDTYALKVKLTKVMNKEKRYIEVMRLLNEIKDMETNEDAVSKILTISKSISDALNKAAEELGG